MANYEKISLEKGMYGVNSKSMTDILEELDPSENYKGTPLENLDAFQRQLKRFDIKVKGAGSDSVRKFFATTQSAALFPEYVSRAVKQGIEEA
ncbi:MAG: phage major capsid protein, partial [Ruminococcus sp.]|nr:phage major capsid protein [Ruminococcus sp.]